MESCADCSVDESDPRSDLPTTRPALLFPSADAADSPCGTAEEAILVIEMDDVFVARMVSGLVSAAKSENIRCLSSRFSEAALRHDTPHQQRATRTTPFTYAPQSPYPRLATPALPQHDQLRTRVLVLVVHPPLESFLLRHLSQVACP
jgi:hypothetical protein